MASPFVTVGPLPGREKRGLRHRRTHRPCPWTITEWLRHETPFRHRWRRSSAQCRRHHRPGPRVDGVCARWCTESRCAARGSDHAVDRPVSPVTPHGSVPGCVAMESLPSSRNGSALDHAAQDDHGRSMSISTVAATSSNGASAGARSPAPLSFATSNWRSTICILSRLPSFSAIL